MHIRVHDQFESKMLELNIAIRWKEASARVLPQFFTMDDKARMEPFTGIHQGVNLCSMGSFSYSHSPLLPDMTIGRYCSISWGLNVTGANHPLEWLSTSNLSYETTALNLRSYVDHHPEIRRLAYDRSVRPAPVIGNDVWIGQNVSMNRGISVGDGAVIAAFSVVTRDVPPYAVVGGNPAQIIRMRFPDSTISRLLSLAWWRWSPAEVFTGDYRDVNDYLGTLEDGLPQIAQFQPQQFSGEDLVRLTDPASEGLNLG